jgi:hypothetical protein
VLHQPGRGTLKNQIADLKTTDQIKDRPTTLPNFAKSLQTMTVTLIARVAKSQIFGLFLN